MERKLRVALLFGGRSGEHDVSLMSAANVFRAHDPARLAELAGVPYVGANVFAAAAAMDKDAATPAARCRAADRAVPRRDRSGDAVLSRACGRAGPAAVRQAGSARRSLSAKWTPPKGSRAALREAFRHDRKVLVEECMRGREVECGVIEDADGTLMTSLPGETTTTKAAAT
jgi:D-alanine-D-alanine ligase